MTTISFHQPVDPGNGRTSVEEIPEKFYPSLHEHNITDGGEFLDDAIRTIDQPLEEILVAETNTGKVSKEPGLKDRADGAVTRK